MAQIDANATKEQIAQMEREFARKRKAAAARRAAELARLSEMRSTTSEDGTIWSYFVVDGSFARVTLCETEAKDLTVPDELDGFPVRELDPDALSSLFSPETITCSNGIDTIRAYAFRGCQNLRRLVLPAATATFSASLVALCPQLEELVLPGALEVVTADVVANPSVKSLVIGRHARAIVPGAFEKSQLRSVVIDERNEHLATDGTCIYTTDGCDLIALALPVAHYAIAPGCRRIAKKAFAGAKQLVSVTLANSVQEIDSLAFANAGITSISCPAALKAIGAKAFMRCLSLQQVELNEGLRSLGADAFAGSALEQLHIPATVDDIGRSFISRSRVRAANPHATLSVDSENPRYYLDAQGCLYRREGDGLHLAEFLDPNAQTYRVDDEAIAIDEKAFAHHPRIESVELPEGLARIEASAFRVCPKLRRVSIPSSLEAIGTEAFIDTQLEQLRIPASLVDIGPRALVTSGSHHEGQPPALREIDVEADSPRFFMRTGMLCRRRGDDASVVMFTNTCDAVDFPDNIVEVEDYAFNNAFGISQLHLNARLRTIGACGLSVMCSIRNVRIDVAKPIEGRTTFSLHFPETSHSVHGFLLALGGLGHLYLPDIMAQYDSFIARARDYRAPGSSDNASAYEQAQLIIERLSDAVLLTDASRQRYHAIIAENLVEICIDIARHDDRAALRSLADLGFLNAHTIEDVIIGVARLQDASATGYLLEMKRLRFHRNAVDFDL